MSTDTRQEAQATLDELYRSLWTLSALSVALERGLVEAIASPALPGAVAAQSGLPEALVGSVLDVLSAAGFVAKQGEHYVSTAGFAELTSAGADALRADLRSTLATNRHVTLAAQTGEPIGGWRTSDAVAVEAQGTVSRAVTRRLMADVFPTLAGLDERLRADAATALDVGAGAAGIPIALCQQYPTLRVVGLEPSTSAVTIARRLVAESGLSERIELREQLGEGLAEREAYDFVYIAQMFFPDGAVDEVFRAAVRALKPGGYLLTGAACAPGVGRPEAVSRLRSVAWSGGIRFASDVMQRLTSAGLSAVRLGPAYGSLQWIVGRRDGRVNIA